MINKIIISLLVCINCFVFGQAMVLVIPSKAINREEVAIQQLQKTFKVSEHYARSIYFGSKIYNFNPLLVASLFQTESNFKPNAVSSKGYVGIAQVPAGSSLRLAVNMVTGLDILNEKMRYAGNNINHALALYKGGNNSEARKQAQEVLTLYHKKTLY